MDDKNLTLTQIKEELEKAKQEAIRDKDAYWENIKREMGDDVDISTVKDIPAIIEESLRPMLADLNLSETEYAFMQTTIIAQIDDEVNYMLEDLLPEETWNKIELLYMTKNLKPEEVMPITILAYEAIMGQPIQIYLKALMQDIVAKNKAAYIEDRAYVQKYNQLSPEDRQRFDSLIDEDKFEEAKKLLL